MREDLRNFEKQNRLSDKKEDFKQCTGATDKDAPAQCCMCGNIHLVKGMTEVGDGQWKCRDCEKNNEKLVADGAEIECEKNKVITHSADETLKEDLDADLDKYNQYINFLKAQLKQDEEVLKNAKKQGDGNEFAVKVMEKRVQADKDELEAALPKIVKDSSTDLNAESKDKIDLTDNDKNTDHEEDKKENLEDDRLELSED